MKLYTALSALSYYVALYVALWRLIRRILGTRYSISLMYKYLIPVDLRRIPVVMGISVPGWKKKWAKAEGANGDNSQSKRGVASDCREFP